MHWSMRLLRRLLYFMAMATLWMWVLLLALSGKV
jgi:hypothetical protein